MKFGVAILTHNGASRVDVLLESMRPDRHAVDQILICEDPLPRPIEHRENLRDIADKHDVTLSLGPKRVCAQGNATRAMALLETDVVCLLSDDIILTPGCLTSVRTFWERWWHFPIGAAQIPYWANRAQLVDIDLIRCEDDFYAKWREYIEHVPRNPTWEFDGKPWLHVNVHGSGFAVRRDVWYAVGGCSQDTWCYDEDISFRIWTMSPCVVVAVPGPPFVHYGGAAGPLRHGEDYNTLRAWLRAWGDVFYHRDYLVRRKMREREYVNELFRTDVTNPKELLTKQLQEENLWSLESQAVSAT